MRTRDSTAYETAVLPLNYSALWAYVLAYALVRHSTRTGGATPRPSGYKDSNLRSPVPKTGALATRPYPDVRQRCMQRTGVVSFPVETWSGEGRGGEPSPLITSIPCLK